MSLPPAFEDRNAAQQIIGAVVVTMIFGLVTGFALGWNEIAYQAGLVFVTTIVGAGTGRGVPGPARAVAAGLRFYAASSAGSISWTSLLFGSAPMIWCATWPCLKRSSVGIDITL